MIVKTKPIKFNIYHSVDPFNDMLSTSKVQIANNFLDDANKSDLKTTFFCRYIGIESTTTDYYSDLKLLDDSLSKKEYQYIKFTKSLEKPFLKSDIEKYKSIMTNYIDKNHNASILPSDLYEMNLAYVIDNEVLDWTKKLAFLDIINTYDQNHANNLTSKKNFGIKILFWIDKYLPLLFAKTENRINQNRKIIFYGDISEHELYFLIFLSKLACDILYLNPKSDICIPKLDLDKYSNLVLCENLSTSYIDFPNSNFEAKASNMKIQNTTEASININPNVINNTFSNENQQITKDSLRSNLSHTLIEKSYEELALFASSVVMINVYDQDKELIGRGSGVVINTKGFIITNFHVAGPGSYFGVIFENDDVEYFSDTIIKYQQDYDLALIKVSKFTNSIKINTKPLVRGQKILSIGSPLGLFNTISDGIVSGFRAFDSEDMIQITAPISPGSSGGALLNMYGELVGITTAGFKGQNLNLALPSKYIELFAGNVIEASSKLF